MSCYSYFINGINTEHLYDGMWCWLHHPTRTIRSSGDAVTWTCEDVLRATVTSERWCVCKTEGDSGGFKIEKRGGKKSMAESSRAAGTQTDSLRVMMRSCKREGQRHWSRREDRACVEEKKREIREEGKKRGN